MATRSRLFYAPLARAFIILPTSHHCRKIRKYVFYSLSTENLRKQVDSSCADPRTDILGVTVPVVGKDGNDLFVYSAGKRGIESDEPRTPENVF